MAKKLTTEEFISRAKSVHGDKYDYSNVEYRNSHTKVKIICKEHGEFCISPSNHLKGQGCPICKNKENVIEEKKEEIKVEPKAETPKLHFPLISKLELINKI